MAERSKAGVLSTPSLEYEIAGSNPAGGRIEAISQ